MSYNNELYHHGIKGQKWGVRRYQNADGSYTASGRKRYGISSEKYKSLSKAEKKKVKSDYKIEGHRQALENMSSRRADAEKERAKEYKRRIDDLKKNGVNSEEWKNHVKEVQEANARRLQDKLDENEFNTGSNMSLKRTAAELGMNLAVSGITKKFMQNNDAMMEEHLSNLKTKHKERMESAKLWTEKTEILKNFKADDLSKRGKVLKALNLGSNTRYNKTVLNNIYENTDRNRNKYYKKEWSKLG